jgi:hypothetical protein
VSVGLLAAAAALLSPAAPPASYCSPSGDYCIAVRGSGQAALLELATFSFSGRYRLCVADPRERRSCRRFALQRRGDLFRSRVLWSENFPRRGPGIYRVTWHYMGVRLGLPLSFRVR